MKKYILIYSLKKTPGLSHEIISAKNKHEARLIFLDSLIPHREIIKIELAGDLPLTNLKGELK